MSNIEVDFMPEEYASQTMTNRKSCPNQQLEFAAKSGSDSSPFDSESMSSPKKSSKKSSITKGPRTQGNFNHGRWSKEEHRKFLEAIKIYGRDWKKVQYYVGTRTSTQARSHAQKVLPHPSCGEGVTASLNSTSTTLTKESPLSHKNCVVSDTQNCQSVNSDENGNDFPVFKIEKFGSRLYGRSRVNSENNVFKVPMEPSAFGDDETAKGVKTSNRKYSMNIEFNFPQNDLVGSPINEPIREQISEDDEEDKFENLPGLSFKKNKTWEPQLLFQFDSKPLFSFENKGNDLDLENWDKANNLEYLMDIDEGLAPLNSLNNMSQYAHNPPLDQEMEPAEELLFNVEADMEDNYYPVPQLQ